MAWLACYNLYKLVLLSNLHFLWTCEVWAINTYVKRGPKTFILWIHYSSTLSSYKYASSGVTLAAHVFLFSITSLGCFIDARLLGYFIDLH